MGGNMHSSAVERGGARWYVAQTKPRAEALALTHLGNQNFSAFSPMRTRVRRLRGRTIHARTSFFPGYVFVRLDLERQRWRSVNGTIGVTRLVGFGERNHGQPAPLPPGLVERLQELSGADGELRFEEQFSPGDTVRIMGGPFDQLIGTLESAGDLERVTILLDILSKETRVRLSRDMLVPA